MQNISVELSNMNDEELKEVLKGEVVFAEWHCIDQKISHCLCLRKWE